MANCCRMLSRLKFTLTGARTAQGRGRGSQHVQPCRRSSCTWTTHLNNRPLADRRWPPSSASRPDVTYCRRQLLRTKTGSLRELRGGAAFPQAGCPRSDNSAGEYSAGSDTPPGKALQCCPRASRPTWVGLEVPSEGAQLRKSDRRSHHYGCAGSGPASWLVWAWARCFLRLRAARKLDALPQVRTLCQTPLPLRDVS